MRERFFFLFFILISFSAFSQETVLLEGKILADSLEGSFINIVNLTRETGSVNNEFGEFEIEVAVDDTLYFSSVQYEGKEIIVIRKMVEEKYLDVILVPKINELAEVKISNISLSGNLERDLSNIKTYNQADYGIPFPTKTKPTSIERKIYTASSGNIGLILNTLNGRLKMLKKAKANQELDILVNKGMNALPMSAYVDNFKIPEEHVVNFVYFCSEDPRFKVLVNSDVPLDLLEFYEEKVPYFLENRMGK